MISLPHIHPMHRNLWYRIFELTYGLMQGGAAKIQALRIAKNLPISHFWWAAAMVVIALLMVVSYKRMTHCKWGEALKLGGSLLLIRFITFSPWLNRLRGKSFFYVGKGAVSDKLLNHWFPIAWIVALVSLVLTNLF